MSDGENYTVESAQVKEAKWFTEHSESWLLAEVVSDWLGWTVTG